MAFEPIQLVHPKTGVVVTATTAVDLTNFRFNDGYVPAEQAKVLVGSEGGAEKYPKLVEGLKVVDEIEKAQAGDEPEPEAADEKPDTESEKPAAVSSPKGARSTGQAAKTAAKSGTDASGNDVGVS
ncbi:hypothetical protein SEA_EMIANNA_36 [Gordonia phage Emianna]|uniref:Uncharacterized protein n=2 Tax=Foxborovirus TaxID=2948710 RepID=A0A385UH54_9CAUD|nr:virion structural protein [Gordonia phage Foxboro]YP_010098924.1 virion structural protein [Gordonia phage Emianna]AYD84308.1 hypothetical protein SEA_KURT_36 [Gordonia phage Kurt]QZD98879.1 hypothetical protein SEA_TRACKER_36 [Gordonia phage Tracker]WNM66076.1 hypothetical protein SEA_WHEEZY_36 [Gordonia phage Wheezy]AYB69159.1 hypothetical protein SEA_FOXBORO_37 [Gordonia phage Foxboro]AYD83421.1 hypothetical protein SEA_EMIANNA_36 [Gordonia phage Emianna]